METLLAIVLNLTLPFKLENENFWLGAFIGGVVVDLIYGSVLGLTSLYLLIIGLALTFYSRGARLRIRLKLAFSLLICLIYFYVIRRNLL